jgi:hypothetical protein
MMLHTCAVVRRSATADPARYLELADWTRRSHHDAARADRNHAGDRARRHLHLSSNPSRQPGSCERHLGDAPERHRVATVRYSASRVFGTSGDLRWVSPSRTRSLICSELLLDHLRVPTGYPSAQYWWLLRAVDLSGSTPSQRHFSRVSNNRQLALFRPLKAVARVRIPSGLPGGVASQRLFRVASQFDHLTRGTRAHISKSGRPRSVHCVGYDVESIAEQVAVLVERHGRALVAEHPLDRVTDSATRARRRRKFTRCTHAAQPSHAPVDA